MNRAIEGYAPVLDGLENDLDEVEAEGFGGNSGRARAVYTSSPARSSGSTRRRNRLPVQLERLVESGAMDDLGPEAREHLNYIRDRVLRVTQQIEGFRDLLSSILGVNLTMVGSGKTTRCRRSLPGEPSW